MSQFNLPSPSPLLVSPREQADLVRGKCWCCKENLGEIAYKHPDINETICKVCAYDHLLNVLRETPLDELDGIPAMERAELCRDGCGFYSTDCRCP